MRRDYHTLQGVSSRDSGGFSWNNQVMNFSPSDKDSSLQRQIAEIVVRLTSRTFSWLVQTLIRECSHFQSPSCEDCKASITRYPSSTLFPFLFGGLLVKIEN